MKFKTSDGYIVERTVRRTYPPVLWTDGDLTFQNERGWPVDDSGEKLDGEFLPETPLDAERRRIESVLTILDDWDDWTTDWAAPQKNWRPPNSVSKLRRPTLSARRPAWSRSKLNRARRRSLS